MNELDELLAACDEIAVLIDMWKSDTAKRFQKAHRAYKAATPPLVLEAVECTESVILFDYWGEDESVQYNGQCYKLPDGGET